MSETETATPENAAPPAETVEEATPAEPETDPAEELAKWKALARKNEEQAKKNSEAARKLQELEDAQKSEQQKLAEALDAAKAEGSSARSEAARLRAAIKHGLTEDDLDLLGDGTPDEIEARAERLAARISSSSSESAERGVTRRPDEHMRPGATPSTTPLDPFKDRKALLGSRKE